jgi:CHAT domain-containing protein
VRLRQILGRFDGQGDVVQDLDSLLRLIDYGNVGLLHFACHNTFRADKAGSVIQMGGGPFVPNLLNSAVARRTLTRQSPIVFVNACRSAGAIAEYTQMMGWAQQFMAAGAGAFLGTLWEVRSGSASAFAETFYGALADGQPLGNAARMARNIVAVDASDPTWLAYSVYGDPYAVARS